MKSKENKIKLQRKPQNQLICLRKIVLNFLPFHSKSLLFRWIGWQNEYNDIVTIFFSVIHPHQVNPKTSTVKTYLYIYLNRKRDTLWDDRVEWGGTKRIIPLIRITCTVKDQENISIFMCSPRVMVLNLRNKFNEKDNHFS